MPTTVTNGVTVWRRIPGTAYAASSAGQVRREDPGQGTWAGRLLKPWIAGGRQNGNHRYEYVCLCHEGRRQKVAVHIVVALAFHGPRPGRWWVVEHKDSDPLNNRPDNLEWVDRGENWARWFWYEQPQEAYA